LEDFFSPLFFVIKSAVVVREMRAQQAAPNQINRDHAHVAQSVLRCLIVNSCRRFGLLISFCFLLFASVIALDGAWIFIDLPRLTKGLINEIFSLLIDDVRERWRIEWPNS
jgi:hypothetical protein